jgi:hypothetical protein
MALTGNIRTDTTELVNTYYEKKALLAEKPFLVLEQFADKSKDIPKYRGDTVTWWKRIPMDVSITALTEGSSPAAENLEFQNVSAKVSQYGKVVALSDILGFTSIDPEVSSKTESLGENRGKTINRLYWQEIVRHAYPMRIDQDTTYDAVCTCDSTTDSSTTIFTTNDGLPTGSGTDDARLVGGVLVAVSGNNKGLGGYISAATAGDVTLVTADAVNESFITNDLAKIANSYGITSADELTCAGIDRAVKVLQQHHAQTFNGFYIGVLSPYTQYDIRQDSAWVNAQHYAGSTKLFNGEIGQWNGVRFVLDTDPWRSAAGTMGTYSASGAVFHTPIFGKEAYAGVRIKGVQDHLIFHDKTKTGDNLEMYSTAGWKAAFVAKMLNATWCVQILSGATDIS